MPSLASLHRTERPVEEISHVGEDFDGLATATIELGEAFWCAVESVGSTVGESGNGMAKQLSFVIHRGKYIAGRERKKTESEKEFHAVSVGDGEELGHVLWDCEYGDLLEIILESCRGNYDEDFAGTCR